MGVADIRKQARQVWRRVRRVPRQILFPRTDRGFAF